jgi:hypothetical protein
MGAFKEVAEALSSLAGRAPAKVLPFSPPLDNQALRRQAYSQGEIPTHPNTIPTGKSGGRAAAPVEKKVSPLGKPVSVLGFIGKRKGS